ncbi:MAG: Gfo/Idh/MocA family oxidoreductase [Rhodobacter sp.]|nr:Gfo/Idh/MocA family oxidoreductase [Rhodobacter sp.]
MKEIAVGIVGGGYMGKAHSVAMAAVGAVFATGLRPRLEMIAADTPESAERYRVAYGFARATGNWRDLVSDPGIEAVVIASPQATHREIAVAALDRGLPVMCEKPMGASLEDARAMVAAAKRSGCPNMVAYNYIRTPASQYARRMVNEGALGRITWFRGEHTEDFHNETDVAAWRYAGRANGCIGDLAPHIFNAALALVGPVDSLSARIETVHERRGGREVTNDDQVQMMVRFANGAMGHLFGSRVATGRKMGYAYEIAGTAGSIRFDQEDQNALWYYDASDPPERRGFRKILAGPAHPDYLPFCRGPGHGTGYQDQIIIEAKDFLTAIETGTQVWPTFRDGLEVRRIVEAAFASHESGSWISLDDII